jgi:hypothetical protein
MLSFFELIINYCCYIIVGSAAILLKRLEPTRQPALPHLRAYKEMGYFPGK